MESATDKYLGIDWGEKRIGLAMGDGETRIAVPFKVAGSIDEIIQVIQAEKIDKIIIGQPISKSGDASNLRQEFRDFAEAIKARSNLDVEFIDERLSSKAADALAGGKKTKAPRDALAAMLILQTYLDKE